MESNHWLTLTGLLTEATRVISVFKSLGSKSCSNLSLPKPIEEETHKTLPWIRHCSQPLHQPRSPSCCHQIVWKGGELDFEVLDQSPAKGLFILLPKQSRWLEQCRRESRNPRNLRSQNFLESNYFVFGYESSKERFAKNRSSWSDFHFTVEAVEAIDAEPLTFR